MPPLLKKIHSVPTVPSIPARRFTHASYDGSGEPSSANAADPSQRSPSAHPAFAELSRHSISRRLAAGASDCEYGARAGNHASPYSGGSSSVPDGFTREQIQPFLDLESQYAGLFRTSHIRAVQSKDDIPAERTKEVDMDECGVINTTRDGFDSIGTIGLSSCIAICAKGKNRRNENILGLLHYSGIGDAQETLSEISNEMRDAGVPNPEIFLVGGLISNEEDMCDCEMERDLLALHSTFNITGAKLHVSMSNSDGEANAVNVVMTPDQIYYHKSW